MDRPTKRAIGQIAEKQPGLLNLLVASFVFEWQTVHLLSSTGMDQMGVQRRIPDYVGMWTDRGRCGIDVAVHYLLLAPLARGIDDPGFVSEWLAER